MKPGFKQKVARVDEADWQVAKDLAHACGMSIPDFLMRLVKAAGPDLIDQNGRRRRTQLSLRLFGLADGPEKPSPENQDGPRIDAEDENDPQAT